VKSRWLWRLETLAAGAGASIPQATEPLRLARALDHPAEFRRPSGPAHAAGGAAAAEAVRYAVEAWIRDPYSLYARSILNLSALPRPGEPVGRASGARRCTRRSSASPNGTRACCRPKRTRSSRR
jgi:ATP-dependent helicase/nuclease subunit B